VRRYENSEPASLGLLGIRERLMPWGGRVDIDSSTDEGARIEIIVPLQAETS